MRWRRCSPTRGRRARTSCSSAATRSRAPFARRDARSPRDARRPLGPRQRRTRGRRGARPRPSLPSDDVAARHREAHRRRAGDAARGPARRPAADARARRRPLLPRDPASRRRDRHAHLAAGRYAEVLSETWRASSSPATRTSSTTGSSASTRFVNAGSVGLPYEGDGAARWLWVADGAPELRPTAYDSAAAGRAHARRGSLARRALDRRGADRPGRADGRHRDLRGNDLRRALTDAEPDRRISRAGGTAAGAGTPPPRGPAARRPARR